MDRVYSEKIIGNERLTVYYDPYVLDPSEEFDNYDVYEMEAYRNGEVFGFVLEKQCECCGTWEEVDSCWGFYGIEAIKTSMPYHVDGKWYDFLKDS